MCGIAGSLSNIEISDKIIKKTLNLMKNRGPDFSNFKKINFNQNKVLHFLHSRLSIIDLKNRSNQPFTDNKNILIFNGEIYNYLELKKRLIIKAEKFFTNSDTEVLLKYYNLYGDKCLEFFEGMWSFAIYDSHKKEIFLSRDRFGEKPLYYLNTDKSFIFGSEIKFIRSLYNKNLDVNYDKINRFLSFGYKSIYEKNDNYFKNIKSIIPGNYLKINNNNRIFEKKYWSHKVKKISHKIDHHEISTENRRLLIKSIKLRTRSDVPISLNLSGGIDSTALASVCIKILNLKIKTFSIISRDNRYDESDNINATLKDLGCENEKIYFDNKPFLKNLDELISYHDSPIATINLFLSSLMAKSIKQNGYKVSINGLGADEIYSGYYDHYLFHLNELKTGNEFNNNLLNWKKYILGFTRNPNYKNYEKFLKNIKDRKYVYDQYESFKPILINSKYNKFREKIFSRNVFTNRRLNETFHEILPVGLAHEDLNNMKYSVENRTPFLDTNLFNFIHSLPNKFLIHDGYNKYILRNSLKKILNKKVRTDRRKKGFNSNIFEYININNKDTFEKLFNKSSKIFNFVKREKMLDLFKHKSFENHMNKFIFAFISSKLFLDKFDK